MIRKYEIKYKFYLILILVLIFGFLASRILSWQIYRSQTKNLGQSEKEFEKTYQAILDKSQSSAYDLVKDAIGFLKKGQTQLAIMATSKATFVDPRYRDGFVYLGYAYLQAGQNQNALQVLEQARDLDPLHPYTWQLLSIVYQRVGQFDQAKEATEKAKAFER